MAVRRPLRPTRHLPRGRTTAGFVESRALTDPSHQVARRLELARRIARGYERGHPVALTVAGSVGAGLADRWSDLELDCYWQEAPAEAQRRAPIERVGGEDAVLWGYDEGDAEWSEDYRLDGVDVTVSNFTVSAVESFISAVVDRGDADPVKHFRLAAIERCVPLRGKKLVSDWQRLTRQYPDRLIAVLVERALAPEVLLGWAARDALVDRGDEVALHALLSRIEQAVLGTLLAINRTYEGHRLPKWQRHLIGRLQFGPPELNARLRLMWVEDHALAVAAAEDLLSDTLALADQHSEARLSEFREAFAARRRPAIADDPGE